MKSVRNQFLHHTTISSLKKEAELNRYPRARMRVVPADIARYEREFFELNYRMMV